MTLALALILALFPRPAANPISPADVETARALRRLFQQPRIESLPAGGVPFRAAPIPGRFVIGFLPGMDQKITRALVQTRATVRTLDSAAGLLVLETAPDLSLDELKERFQSLPGVRFIEPDYPVHALFLPNDPMFSTHQWDKWVMYADLAWEIVRGGTVRVAVVDNGVDYHHPDLAANFLPDEPGYDFIGNDPDPRPDNPVLPYAFHGTHVAGIVAAVSDNLLGVAGWAQVKIYALRVLNDSGNGTLSDVALGIRWAVDHGAKVINLSLGGSATSTPLNEACAYAYNHGALLVAAVGNDGRSGILYPARLRECLAVGALDEQSELASFSNYGPEQELVAPGVGIVSTAPGNTYLQADGTSMSCPEVSGVAALLFCLIPDLTPADVRVLLAASAIDLGPTGKDPYFGYGLVNARRALELAQTLFFDHSVSRTARQDRAPFATTLIITRKSPLRAIGTQPPVGFDGVGRRLLIRPATGHTVRLPGPGVYFLNLASDRKTPRYLKAVVLP